MAYYKKQDVLDYVSGKIKELDERSIQPLNPEAEVIKRLNDEEDLVGFFWIDYNQEVESGQKIKMEGKTWYRINHDIYTDDRFAIDLYQAMKADLTVTDIIKKRELEKEQAQREGVSDIETLEKKVEENINKDGD
jgi:hypothetical protein